MKRARPPVMAAGGIVIRGNAPPLIAIVRLSKHWAWVLPKGKLKLGEEVLAAAQREVLEETGHAVSVHEFLGSMSHTIADGRLKVVQFWRMHASETPARALMDDVKAVKWLPLDKAVKKLTHAHEQAFLAQVGPAALQAAALSAQPIDAAAPPAHAETGAVPARNGLVETIRAWFRRVTHMHA